jgi:hypothetical protein
MADRFGRCDRRERGGMLERLGCSPGLASLLRLRLQVAAGEIDADGIAVDAIERILDGDVAAATFQGDDQFDLVMNVGGQGRVGEGATGCKQVVRVLLEEERRLAVRVVAHFDRVGCIVSADAIDPANRKADEAAGNRQQHGKRWGDNCFHDRPVLGVRLSQPTGRTPRVCWVLAVGRFRLRRGKRESGRYCINPRIGIDPQKN